MFEVNLLHGAADRLRRTLLAVSPATDAEIRCLPYAIVVDISPDEVELVLYKRRRLPESLIVCALLRIRPLPDEYSFIHVDAPATFILPLSDLIQKLSPAEGYEHDEPIISFHRLSYVPKNHLGFHNTKPAAGTPGSSLMNVMDYQGSEWRIPTNDYEFRTIINIPAENFKRLVIKLNNFADDVSVRATRTEVKFSAANEEVILRTQPGANLDTADCILDDFPDADEVSFSFSLQHREMIMNTCELTEIVRLLHCDGLKPMLSCTVSGLGRLVLFFDWPC